MDLLSNTDVMLTLALHQKDEKKILKKLILKMLKRVSPAVAQGVLSPILNSSNMQQAITDTFNSLDEVQGIQLRIRDEGYQGTIQIENIVYPVSVTIEDPEDLEWARNNEAVLAKNIAKAAANMLGLHLIICNVFLFPEAGFSGIRFGYAFERPISNAIGLHRPNKNPLEIE